MGIKDVNIKYNYSGTFLASPEVQSMAASWYNEGTELIFACGGQIGTSIMTAAEASGGKVIGVDVDQSYESGSVITSAIKGISVSVTDALEACYNGNFPGGEAATLGASSDAVGLPIETSKFNTFSEADYKAIYDKLASGKITVKTNADAANVTDLGVKNVAITYIG